MQMQYLLWLSLKVFFLPSLRKQGAGRRHHEDQTVKKTDKKNNAQFFPSWKPSGDHSRFPAVLSTYNTPTIITWIGPWRYVILCMNLYFSSLCMMMGRMTEQRRREKEKRLGEVQEHLKSFMWCCGVLIPGAAMVIREMTTWEMPFTAAFCHRDRDRAQMSKVTGKIVFIQTSWLLTVEWPSLLPFSSVTAMPFRISLEKGKKENQEKGFTFALSSSSIPIYWHLFVDFWTCRLQNEGFSWPDESTRRSIQ